MIVSGIRSATNTLILTHLSDELLGNPQPLVDYISSENNYLVELVSLPRFGRIIIICETSQISTEIAMLLKSSPEWNHIRISYSIKDNKFSIVNQPDMFLAAGNQSQEDSVHVEYLELPSESDSRRFLISPPLSPHSEWDHWDKAEEGPNEKTMYSPQELSHLLWERLGGFDSSIVRKYKDEEGEMEIDNISENEIRTENGENTEDDKKYDLSSQPEILFQNIDNGVPAIVLDSIKNENLRRQSVKSKTLAKTAMPPSFDI
ncbi:predicted protein [Scheffersomyces stipitis CBS 6054]|uniref:Calcipressin-like protein n=1 Tax=Scheffersomyces stipitis (strain ATCC 58785 / CBS 6054 / NBRC 10063 / NRRL Y-11545) TaxID=322104 RepID=A3LUV4_PICST|nr:predicted protein [Scheffersomyces stipitis CBS 6054]ABN66659.2 predicted protein [Scheffersomyces stipitis CBS 6054]